jgi:hypothetical protein
VLGTSVSRQVQQPLQPSHEPRARVAPLFHAAEFSLSFVCEHIIDLILAHVIIFLLFSRCYFADPPFADSPFSETRTLLRQTITNKTYEFDVNLVKFEKKLWLLT